MGDLFVNNSLALRSERESQELTNESLSASSNRAHFGKSEVFVCVRSARKGNVMEFLWQKPAYFDTMYTSLLA